MQELCVIAFLKAWSLLEFLDSLWTEKVANMSKEWSFSCCVVRKPKVVPCHFLFFSSQPFMLQPFFAQPFLPETCGNHSLQDGRSPLLAALVAPCFGSSGLGFGTSSTRRRRRRRRRTPARPESDDLKPACQAAFAEQKHARSACTLCTHLWGWKHADITHGTLFWAIVHNSGAKGNMLVFS